ncbi:MAG: hypothetical protein ACFWTY_01255 [Shouchella clausii]
MMRGIVVSPKYVIDGNNIRFPGLLGIEDFDLRRYLMYWDKIDYPNSNMIDIVSSPDILYLEEVGVLKRTGINVSGDFRLDELYPMGQLQVFNLKNALEPGSWSLAQSTPKLNLLKKDTEKTRVLEVELYQCLPVPTENVSLDEILEFKQRRNSELLEFRFLMDKLYLDTIESGDFERAKTHNIELLQKKIFDIDRLMGESRFNRVKTNLSTNISISDLVVESLKGFTAGAFIGMPEWGALAGFASSFIKLDLGISSKPKGLPEGIKDYAYLYHAKKELG